MTRVLAVAALLLASSLGRGAPLSDVPPPLVVGSEGVPVPKKVRDLKPKYPPEAIAQGIRGIVILDLVIDTSGHVESVNVIRSVPGLDDAAVAAAHQWQYQPVKVAGHTVRVRMTVPITFSLALPSLAREAGVPELRQGVAPAFPKSAEGGGTATVAVMLAPDGRIVAKGPLEGSQEPWTRALLDALDTWRFAPATEDTIVSFRIEAEFVHGRGSQPPAVRLKATNLKVADARAAEAAQTAAAVPAAPAPATPPPAAPPMTPAPTAEPPEVTPPPAAPAPVPGTPPASATAPATSSSPAVAPAAASVAPPAGAAPTARAAASESEAEVEVVSSPPPPAPALPPENGMSLIPDVTLAPGVPELARGRQPVPPPFARLAGVTGTVEVQFSVGAGGITTVRTVTGPELLKPAAEQAVASWVFHRTRADRAYLLATFSYEQDKASASVQPEGAVATPAAPTPAESAPPPAGASTPAQAPALAGVPTPAP